MSKNNNLKFSIILKKTNIENMIENENEYNNRNYRDNDFE
jgi:hypothetical protein